MKKNFELGVLFSAAANKLIKSKFLIEENQIIQ